MTSNVVLFPKAPRRPPHPDARPILSGYCLITIEPDDEGWSVIECSESGAALLGSALPKWAAIEIGLDWVRRWNAELQIRNKFVGAELKL